MKKILLIIFFYFLIFPQVALSQKSDTEKQNQTEIYFSMWYMQNDCWYEVNQQMTNFVNKIFEEGRLYAYETHQLNFWQDLTKEVTEAFPSYDYSKCSNVTPEEKALQWAAKNLWFKVNDDMTDYAYLIHGKLLANGISPTENSEEYYGEIDRQMRMKFPNYDWE